jgi:hypothetical protein
VRTTPTARNVARRAPRSSLNGIRQSRRRPFRSGIWLAGAVYGYQPKQFHSRLSPSSSAPWQTSHTSSQKICFAILLLHHIMGDWCKTGGQAAMAVGGHESLAGWNFCPNSEPSEPL